MQGLGERVVGPTALKMNLPAFMKAFTDEASLRKPCAPSSWPRSSR